MQHIHDKVADLAVLSLRKAKAILNAIATSLEVLLTRLSDEQSGKSGLCSYFLEYKGTI